MRRQSIVAEGWWDYTTLDSESLEGAARLSIEDLVHLERIRSDLRMPDDNIHFLTADNTDAYTSSYDNPNVTFNFYRPSIGECRVEIH